MKILFALFVQLALSAHVPEDVATMFSEWKVSYGRTYASLAEHNTRLEHFHRAIGIVAELNRAHSHRKNGATFKLNKFADRSPDELKALRGFKADIKDRTNHKEVTEVNAAPTSFDWRTKGVINPIQDQGQCGSCWAFSATANIESRWAIAKGVRPIKLAEQALVDCDQLCGTYRSMQGCDAGCNGGLMPNAYKYVIANGQPTEASYPYQAVDGTCKRFTKANVSITSWEFVAQNEATIAAYLAENGPVSIAVDASNWSYYYGGVMEYLCWGKTTYNDLDHGVELVGYGTDELGTDYWIVRNSWSTDWGDAGYARILRGTNFCGVALFATSAIV